MRFEDCKKDLRVEISHRFDGMGGLGGAHGRIVDTRQVEKNDGSWLGNVRVHLDDGVDWGSREPWFPAEDLTPEAEMANPSLIEAKELLDQILGNTRFVVTGEAS